MLCARLLPCSLATEEHWVNLTRELMELTVFREQSPKFKNGLAANPSPYALHLAASESISWAADR